MCLHSTPALAQALHGRLVCMARSYSLLVTTVSAPLVDDLMTDMEQHADPGATEHSRMAAVQALSVSGALGNQETPRCIDNDNTVINT